MDNSASRERLEVLRAKTPVCALAFAFSPWRAQAHERRTRGIDILFVRLGG